MEGTSNGSRMLSIYFIRFSRYVALAFSLEKGHTISLSVLGFVTGIHEASVTGVDLAMGVGKFVISDKVFS